MVSEDGNKAMAAYFQMCIRDRMIPMFIMLAPLYQLLAKVKMLNDLRSLAMLLSLIHIFCHL